MAKHKHKHRHRRRAGRKRRRPEHGEVGSPPGSLDIDPDAHASSLSLLAFGRDFITERALAVEDLANVRGTAPVVWVNVDGLGDANVMQTVGKVFGLHRLAMEDVVHVQQQSISFLLQQVLLKQLV